ncbi:biofilm formation regulator BssR [Enterobacteriaceae bacterium 155047]|uniref:biofilm formation regulator BssR n=1 Tax=Huaxiibacter chinensis TaxID=2899785 RepID=UPI0007DAA7C8|nr:biofilm formation regulator BssR [Huaxiibacter chinensis]ANG92184.1 transcriptional regulator [Lelliottia amnigena]MCG5043008.1 biofilm formation regulator BssR [Huaxiibacter chinensis]
MSVDRLKRDLLNKLINARIDIAAYLQLRTAKGYMSVSESEHLGQNCLGLCNEMRDRAPVLRQHYDVDERQILRQAALALSQVAVCMMTGHHDCPTFVAVDARKLENCLTTLTLCIMSLKEHHALGQA